MSIGRVGQPVEVPIDQLWSMDVRFWLDVAKTQPATISAASAWLRRQGDSGTPAALATSNGSLVLNGGIVGVRAPVAMLSPLPPGRYDFELQATDSTGAVRQVRAVIALVAGLAT